MAKNPKKPFVPRITQLDSLVFDDEIHNILTNQLLEISKFLKPGALSNIKPELNLLIHVLIYKFSILKNKASFGQQLLDTRFEKAFDKRTASWFFLLNYGLSYVKQRYEYSFTGLSNQSVKSTIDKFELLTKCLSVLNLLLFLCSGVFPTLTERLLGLRHAPVNSSNRIVGYSYMSRELLWHGFMELVMFTLPLINYQSVKRNLRSLSWRQNEQEKQQQILIHNSDISCAVCLEKATQPCRISNYCTHIACYYCIKANIIADAKYTCPTCGTTNTAVDHLQYVTF